MTRILTVGPTTPGALPESYARAFECLGMEVVRFDSDRALINASRLTGNRILRRVLRSHLWNAVNRQFLQVAETVRPDLIFAVKSSFLHPETIRQVRKSLGVPFVNHYPDHPYIGIRWDPREASALRRDLIEVLRQYSIVFMWERSLTERLQRDGVEARYLPFAVDQELFQPHSEGEGLYCESCCQQHQVAFAGTRTRARHQEINSIVKHEIAIWGNGWPARKRVTNQRMHLPIYGVELARTYSMAPVSLNVLNEENLSGPNMRTFEIPASGGVMLAKYSEAQAEFFPENEAAAYYRSPEELDAKVEWLLGDAAIRKLIRNTASKIASLQTYRHRAVEVLKEVGLSSTWSRAEVRFQ